MKIEFSKESINKKLSKLKKDKKFNLYAAAGMFVLLILFVLLFQQIRIWTAPPSSQSDYPVLAEIKDSGFGVYFSLSLDELSYYSDLVALVEIEKIHDISTVTYTPEKGSEDEEIMNKLGMGSISNERRRVDLRVKNIIKGDEKKNIISIWEREDDLYALPDFKPGDRFIFFMETYELMDGYVHTTIAEGIYYLAQDNKVYPSRMSDLLAETSGMNYNEFKRRVKNHKSMEEIVAEKEKNETIMTED